MNQRPLGYEPNELPGCSTPRQMTVLIYQPGLRRVNPPGGL